MASTAAWGSVQSDKAMAPDHSRSTLAQRRHSEREQGEPTEQDETTREESRYVDRDKQRERERQAGYVVRDDGLQGSHGFSGLFASAPR